MSIYGIRTLLSWLVVSAEFVSMTTPGAVNDDTADINYDNSLGSVYKYISTR